MSDTIEPFNLSVPQADLDDLRQRLQRTRWPDRETVDDVSQGPQLNKIRALSDFWKNGYDWRRCESLLNGFGQYRTTIDGLGIHFLHVRSPEQNALPLIMTHGWLGSVLELRGKRVSDWLIRLRATMYTIMFSGQALPVTMSKSGFCGVVKSTVIQEAACVAAGAILKREVGREEQAVSADNGGGALQV